MTVRLRADAMMRALSSSGPLSLFLAQFRTAVVETSCGPCRIKRIDGRAAESLHEARYSGLDVAAALPLLFGLLVEDDCGRPLQGANLARLSIEDRKRLLAALIERNAAIFGISTVRGPAQRDLDDAARAFIDSYLDVDDMVGAEIVAAMRASNA